MLNNDASVHVRITGSHHEGRNRLTFRAICPLKGGQLRRHSRTEAAAGVEEDEQPVLAFPMRKLFHFSRQIRQFEIGGERTD